MRELVIRRQGRTTADLPRDSDSERRFEDSHDGWRTMNLGRGRTILKILTLLVLITGGFADNLNARPNNKSEGLEPCPNSPNCVSTQSDDPGRAMNPLPYIGTREESMERLVRVLGELKRCTIVTSSSFFLRAEVRSALFRFVDDVAFLFDDRARLLHFRSASRTGYYDFGVNRRRMEQISALYLRGTEGQK